MVENQDPAGAGRGGDQLLGLGVVDSLHLVIVVEVAYRRLVLDELDAFVVEGEHVRQSPRVAYGHGAGLVLGVGLRHALRQLVGIAAGLCRHWLQVMQYGVDARQAGEGIGNEAHDGPRVWEANKSSGGFEKWRGRPVVGGGGGRERWAAIWPTGSSSVSGTAIRRWGKTSSAKRYASSRWG